MQDYFYIDKDNKQQGPVPPSRLTECGITPDTLVWCSGMSDWMPAKSVDELHDILHASQQNHATPPPHPEGNANGQFGGNYGQGVYTTPNPQPQRPPYPCPSTHLAEAVLVTICCCLPFGIVAIVKATQVNSLYAQGNYDAALLASTDAQKWVMWSLVCGLVSIFLYSGFSLLAMV